MDNKEALFAGGLFPSFLVFPIISRKLWLRGYNNQLAAVPFYSHLMHVRRQTPVAAPSPESTPPSVVALERPLLPANPSTNLREFLIVCFPRRPPPILFLVTSYPLLPRFLMSVPSSHFWCPPPGKWPVVRRSKPNTASPRPLRDQLIRVLSSPEPPSIYDSAPRIFDCQRGAFLSPFSPSKDHIIPNQITFRKPVIVATFLPTAAPVCYLFCY